jgi:hypothetical protein
MVAAAQGGLARGSRGAASARKLAGLAVGLYGVAVNAAEFAVGPEVGSHWLDLDAMGFAALHELTTSMQEAVDQPFVSLARDVNELLTI